jgi:OFA family oxalate/formate antiporter-like MFS transporter
MPQAAVGPFKTSRVSNQNDISDRLSQGVTVIAPNGGHQSYLPSMASQELSTSLLSTSTTSMASQEDGTYVKMEDQASAEVPPPVSVDGPYAKYAVVPSCFMVAFSVMGVQYSAGVINSALLQTTENGGFGKSASTTAWVTALAIGMLMLAMGPAGVIQARIGQRGIVMLGGTMVAAGLLLSSYATEFWHLLLCFSVLSSVGGGFAYLGAVTSTQMWFSADKRAMAMAIASSGSGVGTIVLGTLTQAIDDWRVAFRYLALFSLVGIVVASLLFVPPPKTAAAAGASTVTLAPTYREVLDSSGLRYFMLVLMVFGLGSWNPVVHNVEAAQESGLVTRDQAANAIAIGFGIGSVLGRPVGAKILAYTGRMNGFPAILALLGVTAGLVPAMRASAAAVAINNFFYGWGFGAWISVLPPMTAEMVGMEKFPIALGLVYASPGVTMMLGPVLCGTIKSVTVITGYTTSYDVAYYFSAVMMVLSGFMAVFLKNMKV